MSSGLLDSIDGPEDLKHLAPDDLPRLAQDVREALLAIVSSRGGHLASNLGVVELTIALVRALDFSVDTLVWDTGHSGYVYKLLTGRRELMNSLRQDNGCCGFLHRDESPFDVFGAGHAGTAISAALGMAVARDREGIDGRVVAMVGDGALGCGSSLEGLNNVIETTEDFILVVNDNRMSISPNVGALSRYLSRVIPSKGYNRFRRGVSDAVFSIPKVGPQLKRMIRRVEEAVKSVMVPGVVFEELGLRYVGPLDGHDIQALADTFEAVRQMREPLVVHVLTEKGRGYARAEKAPEVYHGTPEFDLAAGVPAPRDTTADARPDLPFSESLGHALHRMGAADERVVAVTAGMCKGTGLTPFRDAFPDRFFDVGIAEEHAVIFAAGMAARGLRPVVAIYASFMHRAMDYVFHDVCLQKLPVIFCCDRAGIVSDGPTHHGIHDLAFWRAVPNLCVLQPADRWELEHMLEAALTHGEPSVIRYPKAKAENLDLTSERAPLAWGESEVLVDGQDVAIWAVGRETVTAMKVAEKLRERGIAATVVNPRFIMPFDQARLEAELQAGMPIVTLENHCVEGGFGAIVQSVCAGRDGCRLMCRGWPREVIPWGTEACIRAKYRMDVAALAEDIAVFLGTGTAELSDGGPLRESAAQAHDSRALQPPGA